MTVFIESDFQSISRKFAIVAVTSRPRTLTVTVSPSLRPSCAPMVASKETSGGPSWSFAHHVPETILSVSGGVAE